MFRLDILLKEAGERGVKVHIIHWLDHKFLKFANNSVFTKKYLESLNKNIKVLRHPNYVLPDLWSHHEKMVVVD
jgi:phospholipase D1/2